MVRKGSYFLGLTILVVLVSSGFNSIETKEVRGFYLTENEVVSYHVPSEDENEIEDETVVIGNAVPYVGRTFAGFKQAVAFKESRGILNMVNSSGL